jgi:hypothetical protein
MDEYTATIRSAATAIPVAAQMEALFHEIDHFITHYGSGFENKPKMWNSEAFFGGRYILTMQVMVKVDYAHHRVIPVGKPTFYLHEVKSVENVTEGQYAQSFGRTLTFDTETWERLQEARGDFTAIGFEPNPIAVPGFVESVAAIRRDRVRVSLLSPETAP